MSLARLRDHATAIFQAGLNAADPSAAILRHINVEGAVLWLGETPYPLSEVERIWLVGMGKASAAMAQPLVELLGQRITGGVIVVKYGHSLFLPGVEVFEAGHPVPDEDGVEGVEEMIRLLGRTGPSDLVLCLISGGGSALSPAPPPGITLEDKQEVTRLLLGSGATIHEINTVRKHISRIKGGQLARLAHPARMVSLILSDVVGDDLDTIASGPTVPDAGTFQDALGILKKRGILPTTPPSIVAHLESGVRGQVPETPKEGENTFEGVQNLIVGSNALALRAAEKKATEMGYATSVVPGYEEGEAQAVAQAHVALARETMDQNPPPSCILTGGETTVTLRGEGWGGRNQEFALAFALGMEGEEGVLLLSGGTDGTDGPTDAAGAFADGTSVARGRAAGMDAQEYLARNDAYHFFQPLGDLLVTGPTLTNVMDLRILLRS
jgi:hydroxypyruvate reductase